MHWTVERLRMVLVGLGVLAVAVILAALGYTRWQTRRIARDLPAKLGIQIQQSTEGFTYSKTEQGRTVFTLHAANALQYRAGGHAILHDVRIQIFNPKDGSSNTVSGEQFEYDPQTGIVRAAGEAHMDLHVAAGTSASTGASAQHAVHVLTHDLVFNQKTDSAVAGGLIAFDLPQGQGQAVGAVFNGKMSQLILQSKVALHLRTQRGWAWIHATQAIYNQQGSSVQLQHAEYASASERASAQTAEILLRADNSVENIHAQEHVRYRNTSGESVAAESMVAALDASSRPQAAHFAGGVQMDVQQAQQRTHASAQEGQFDFDSAGCLRQAVLDRAVRLRQRLQGTALTRTMQAGHMVLHFSADAKRNLELSEADANGDAVLQQINPVAPNPKQGQQKTWAKKMNLRGQRLVAKFAAGNQLERVNGAGDTEIRSEDADGTVNSSSGDRLTAFFAPNSQAAQTVDKRAMNFDASTLQSAVQQGHVVLRQVVTRVETQRPKQIHQQEFLSGSGDSTITAARAEYAAGAQLVTLTGSPHFQNADMEMFANEMQWNRTTGAMTATGGVRATLFNGAQGAGLLRGANLSGASGYDSTHILADHALLRQKDHTADFSGNARLWQGANVIEAPTLEFLQEQQEILASGAGASGAVHGTFVQAQQSGAHTSAASPMPVNVTGDELVYSDAEHKAHWTGRVVMTMQTEQMQADAVDLYLQPAQPASAEENKSAAAGVLSGQTSVERFVAQGNVQLVQPGRSGTGARIVYTASDGRFVLTGTEEHPPRLVDASQGSLTGRALVFASEQNTVQVLGAQQPTTAVTRVQK